MKKLASLFFIILLFSCERGTKNHLIGDWYFDQIVYFDSDSSEVTKGFYEHIYSPYYNFEFVNDSVLDFKNGFYYSIARRVKSDEYGYNFWRSHYYLGSKTNYKMLDSNIVFYNKTNKVWDTLKIHKFRKDTMVIHGFEKAFYRLVRKQNHFFDDQSYDAITVDRSPCYGSCPFNATYIDRKGNFLFKSFEFNTDYNNFNAKLDHKTVQYYFDLFDKIQVMDLKDHYFVNATDSQTNTISFFKNGKIVKTIVSYIDCPVDLEKAFSELSHAYQSVKVDYDIHDLFDSNFSFYLFKDEKSNFRLKESEGFFLEVALRNGKQVSGTYNLPYELKFSTWDKKSVIEKIMTDGRFFKIFKKDHQALTLDIGYDFIDINPIIKTKRDF